MSADPTASPSFNAQCHCGQLSIQATQAPVAQLVCHCKDCREASGKPYTSIAFFLPQICEARGQSSAITMSGGTGMPKTYVSCVDCGDCLYATVEVLRGMVGIVADLLAPPFEFRPSFHVWTGEKAEGTIIDAGMVQFPKGPPRPPHMV